MLVIAWGNYIQSIYFDGEDEIVKDGVYFTNSEIKSCHFTGDSVLAILDQSTLKIVYTRLFVPGEIKTVLNDPAGMESLIDNCSNAELDDGMN